MTVLTRAILKTLWPGASQSVRTAVVRVAPSVFRQYGLTNDLRVAHFMAQVSHECGGGTIIRENMNYSAGRMMQIFGVGKHSARVTQDEAARLAHRPEEIAERVYGLGNPKKAKELGNARAGDGFRFRGNGMLQLTGGGSHRRIGSLIGVNLYDDPAQLENPAISFKVAAAEFKALNCIPAADDDNIEVVTRRVNGGTNGLSDRREWLRKWKVALAADDGDEPEADAETTVADALSADAVPRAAEKPGVLETIKDSKIAKGAVVVATGEAGDIVSQVGDAASKVKDAKDSGVMDMAVHLMQSPRFWLALALIVIVAGIVYWRWRDHAVAT